MNQKNFAVTQPGVGNVTDGSVDFYGMDWEIVDPGPIEEEIRCGGGTQPVVHRCVDNQPQQTDDAGGYAIIEE